MTTVNQNFTSQDALIAHMQNKVSGCIQIIYSNMTDYEGMVFSIAIIFDTRKAKYELDLEWISFGLDPSGENVLDNYLYQFGNLEALLEYLEANYDIKVTDIPIRYNFDYRQYPNLLKDQHKKAIYLADWHRFRQDFKEGKFKDLSLKLVYSTQEDEIILPSSWTEL